MVAEKLTRQLFKGQYLLLPLLALALAACARPAGFLPEEERNTPVICPVTVPNGSTPPGERPGPPILWGRQPVDRALAPGHRDL